MENTYMRTVSKSLVTLSMVLGLSGAVYAQATPSVAKPKEPTADVAKPKAASDVAKPKQASTPKAATDKPAAVSGENATPAAKSPKHEHATHAVPHAAADKTNKLDKAESTDAKKIETSAPKASPSVSEHKPVVKSESNKPVAKPDSTTPMKHVAKSAEKTPVETAKPAK
jgi:hypothetical protein